MSSGWIQMYLLGLKQHIAKINNMSVDVSLLSCYVCPEGGFGTADLRATDVCEQPLLFREPLPCKTVT